MTTDNRANEPTEARISDADLSDEHLPNRAYKVGRTIAERGDFDGLDAATVFMRGAMYGVRKLAPQESQALDLEKVAEVLDTHRAAARNGRSEEACACDHEWRIREAVAEHKARALCEAYTEGKLT